MYNLKTKFISIERIIIKILIFSNIKKILMKNKERRKKCISFYKKLFAKIKKNISRVITDI